LLVMEKSIYTPRKKHLENGIYTKANFKKFALFKYLFALIPAFILKQWHYITEQQIDVVIDISGFAFGDVWRAKKASNRLGHHIEKWKRQGKRVIMLPQTFGPFLNEELSAVMRNIISYADLICARDEVSYKYLLQLVGNNEKIICAPDFTNLIEGTIPPYFDSLKHQVAIIVNSKMMDNVTREEAEAYINLIHRIIMMSSGLGHNPYFLIHELNADTSVIEAINQKLPSELPVISEDDPLHIKGIISKSTAVFTSRFHGLVSCLSQAVPCLATGWSHKYQMLLQNYNYPEGLLDIHCDDELLFAKVKSVLTEPSKSLIIENLKNESSKQKFLSEEMWKQVFEKMKIHS